jgi:hypothetical protein
MSTEHPDTERCPVCRWPVVPVGQPGCWPGNCSMRCGCSTRPCIHRPGLAPAAPDRLAEADPHDQLIEDCARLLREMAATAPDAESRALHEGSRALLYNKGGHRG